MSTAVKGISRPDLWKKAQRMYGKPVTGVWGSYEVWRIYDKLLKESRDKDLTKVTNKFKQMKISSYTKKGRRK